MISFCLFLSGLPRFFLDPAGNGNGFAAGVGLNPASETAV
jgi:hypothetical protein